jgi:phosphate transport system substrate-binding protein
MKKTKTHQFLTILAGVLLFLSWPFLCFAEELKVGAGAAPCENIFRKIAAPMEKAIGLKLSLIDCGPSEALKNLDQGSVDAASGGLTFEDWMAMMDKEGYKIPDKNAYKYRVIGKDIIKVIVHKDTTVRKLSREQLEGIFSGKITNWKEVGGPDLAIVVVWGNKIPGTNAVFQKQIMHGGSYTSKVLQATTVIDVKEKVSTTRGAVGLSSVGNLDSSILAPEIPETGRPITLITKGAPSPTVLKMLDFLQGEGQKYVVR